MRRSPTEIQFQIGALNSVMQQLPRLSQFGDNHHAAIRAQITVLRFDYSDDQIANNADTDLAEVLGMTPWPEYSRSAAMDAYQWREGKSDEAPADDWQKLAQSLSPERALTTAP